LQSSCSSHLSDHHLELDLDLDLDLEQGFSSRSSHLSEPQRYFLELELYMHLDFLELVLDFLEHS